MTDNWRQNLQVSGKYKTIAKITFATESWAEHPGTVSAWFQAGSSMQSPRSQEQRMGYDPDQPYGPSLSLAAFGLPQFTECFWVADCEELCPLALSVLVINCQAGECPVLTLPGSQHKE